MPGIIGAIDGTHIRIKSPGGDNQRRYINRKGWPSINVQAVCDRQMIFRNIVARWSGSTHDSRIFNNSRLCQKLQNQEINGILLGDQGYACSRFLLTPVRNARTPAQQRFNRHQIRARNVIERSFGVLKMRFPALHSGLRTNLELSKTIIVAAAILHNIAVLAGIEVFSLIIIIIIIAVS